MFVLWQWHAVEESEHKATCDEIYQAAGGGYLRRVLLMPMAWALILGMALFNTAVLLKNDGKLFTRDTLSGLGYLFGWRGVLTRLVPSVLRFFQAQLPPLGRGQQRRGARVACPTPAVPRHGPRGPAGHAGGRGRARCVGAGTGRLTP